MKPTNEELRAALLDLAERSGVVWAGIGKHSDLVEMNDSAESAMALLNRKSCADCEFGGTDGDTLLCSYKKYHGPPFARLSIPVRLAGDYASECEEYKRKVPE